MLMRVLMTCQDERLAEEVIWEIEIWFANYKEMTKWIRSKEESLPKTELPMIKKYPVYSHRWFVWNKIDATRSRYLF